MYETMSKKLKDYADNETKLLDNVRNTILSTYEKGEKFRNRMENELRECNKKLLTVQSSTKDALDFYTKLNDKLKSNIEDLKKEVTYLKK